MKRLVIIILFFMLLSGVTAKVEEPRYIIISSSYNEKDIKYMYEVKNHLLKDYAVWVKGVDDKYQVLADHEYVYNADYKNGIYKIVLGEGKGKELKGELRVSYCDSVKQIKKKSILFDWIF